MWMAVAPIWIASPPAMIAAGISTRPLGTIPLRAQAQEDSAATKPRMKPGAKVSRNPLRPAVRIEHGHEDEREHVVAEDRQSLLDRVAGVRRPDEAGQDRFHDARRNHVG